MIPAAILKVNMNYPWHFWIGEALILLTVDTIMKYLNILTSTCGGMGKVRGMLVSVVGRRGLAWQERLRGWPDMLKPQS